jgi:hypothetical protein
MILPVKGERELRGVRERAGGEEIDEHAGGEDVFQRGLTEGAGANEDESGGRLGVEMRGDGADIEKGAGENPGRMLDSAEGDGAVGGGADDFAAAHVFVILKRGVAEIKALDALAMTLAAEEGIGEFLLERPRLLDRRAR